MADDNLEGGAGKRKPYTFETSPAVDYQGEYLELLCPRCSSSYLHHESVVAYDRKEDDPVTTRTEVGAADLSRRQEVSALSHNPSSRRHGIAIRFSCEECCLHEMGEDPAFELTMAQHKGVTQVMWRRYIP